MICGNIVGGMEATSIHKHHSGEKCGKSKIDREGGRNKIKERGKKV